MQKKILVVDDNEDLLELLGKHLMGSGWQVSLARGSRECWEQLARIPPDVILLDLLLLDGSGLEIARFLKREHSYRRIPILAMTGFYSRRKVDECLQAGCYGVLVKPFSLVVLDQTLTAFLIEPKVEPIARTCRGRVSFRGGDRNVD